MLGFIEWIVVGGIAGWLAGQIVDGAGFGVMLNIILGIVGAALAGFILQKLNFHLVESAFLAELINGVIGGVIILVLLSLIRRA
ncbi:GlsB/YeaQ/YmgE family stress response membrane protein [Methylovirgula sp. 4M-Z18]|uniref:GlsB/YeaQ/YmgE family stress response membrane protein n=1 Tax=Methylovirgula sp. 4M-Z18 TaxID=2293567 RepID=UPI000E2F67EB|nr:GlsB/YeaQ/YmgE family stress response membrane protein [Methylovirgula sp. 4M-Z18]RFB78907.1 GlsB/YeaQ/YmgE family stress response membrane protein [Methylovirgula sp. 4M-Z18]